MVWKEVSALERIEKQAWLCGFLSPCQDPAQLPLPCCPQQNTETWLLKATSAIAGEQGGREGSLGSAARLCLGIQRRKQDVFENVSSVVSCTDGFPPLPSLCCRAVLQLKLQQRRTREELVSQGIMPRKYHLNSLFSCFYVWFWAENGFTYDLKDQILCFWMKNIIYESPTLSHPAWSSWSVATLGMGPPLILRKRIMAPSVTLLQNNVFSWSQWKRVFWRTCYVRSALYTSHMLVITLLTGFLPLQFLFLFVSSPDLQGSCNFVRTYSIKLSENKQSIQDVNQQGDMFYFCSWKTKLERALWASASPLPAGEGKICRARELLLVWVDA